MAGQTAQSKTADKLKREQFVALLGMSASSLEVQASVLPTKQLDPRFSGLANEVVRLNNGTVFSGEYQLTEVITTYEGGKRSRDIAGIGTKIDGLTATKDPKESASKSSASSAVNSKPSSQTKQTGGSGTTGGGKPNAPVEQLQYNAKTNKWTQ